MDFPQAMAALEAAGTEQCRKIYRRHGMSEPLFGVSYAALGKLQKEIKRDEALAERLWASGNGDARVLAAMICVPAQAPLDRWVRDLDSYPVTDAFAKHAAAPAPGAFERALGWIDADAEWVESAGWSVIAMVAMGKGGPDDDRLAALLPRIEREIHGAKNRVRYHMNGAIAAIGLRGEALRDAAVAVAKRVGPVEVDHGDTGCETPLAADVIRRGWERKAAKASGAKAPAKKTAKAATAAKTAKKGSK